MAVIYSNVEKFWHHFWNIQKNTCFWCDAWPPCLSPYSIFLMLKNWNFHPRNRGSGARKHLRWGPKTLKFLQKIYFGKKKLRLEKIFQKTHFNPKNGPPLDSLIYTLSQLNLNTKKIPIETPPYLNSTPIEVELYPNHIKALFKPNSFRILPKPYPNLTQILPKPFRNQT